VTFPIKKRISTELFNGRFAALNIREVRIRVGTKESDQPVVLDDWRIDLRRNAILISNGVGMRDQV